MTPKFGTFEEPLAERYRFEAELGRGGMGTVYRAMDLRLERPVAIKVLHPALTNDVGVARFQSEIRIAAKLRHARIVSVHDSGEAAGHLYYVMDFVDGETLRGRLKREKQLSVEDAIAITSEVAEGLQYAHDNGVVHRDVKPENIILCGGHACVVDFGLARALDSVDENRLTASGLAVGTPHYLSPEQASAEKDVGPKADQYALACVLYEMLAGEPPFTGPTASSIAMKHIATPPEPLRKRRRSVPVHVEVAVARAMEKVPADRFKSLDEFVAALRARSGGWAKKAGVALAAAAVLGVIGAGLANSETSADSIGNSLRRFTGRELDTNRVVVFPVATPGGGGDPALEEGIRNALARWIGVSVASGTEVSTAMVASSDTGRARTVAKDRIVARALRAGRFVTVEVTPTGVTRQLSVELQDTRGVLPARRKVTTLLAGGFSDSLLAQLAYELLFDGEEAERNADATIGTRHLVAFAAFLRGKHAERTWNLVLADSAYSAALRIDPSFPQALLGLAQVRAWMRDDAPDIEPLISRALDGDGRLTVESRLHASALLDLRRGQYREACTKFDSLIARDRTDFAAWLGTGECNRRDEAVVKDLRSRSGYRFRGSLERATQATRRAFDLLPQIDSCCSTRADDLLRRALFLGALQIRRGYGVPPDASTYGAYPESIADTIAFVPLPIKRIEEAPPRSHSAAVHRQRRLFFEIAARRVSREPKNPDALEELVEAMDLRGYRSSIDTVRRARDLSPDSEQKVRLAVSEVWLRLKFALPDNYREMLVARRLADSVTNGTQASSAKDGGLLASLAALTGDAKRATEFANRIDPGNAHPAIPIEVQQTANAMLIYAATGGSSVTLRQLEQRLINGIANGVPPDEQPSARAMLLNRAAMLAFPVYRSEVVTTRDTAMVLLNAEGAYAQNNFAKVRENLGKIARSREGMRAGDLTFEAVYPGAWLLAAIGDSAGALRMISRTLDAVREMPASSFHDPAVAGSLMQAMLLRIELATAVGDTASARMWARAVATLSNPVAPEGRSRHERLAAVAQRTTRKE